MIPLEIMSTMSRMWQVYGANARLTANRSRVFRADEYVVPPRPESREDDILKEVGPDLSDFRCDALCHEKHPPLPGSG